jgi:hypothetical protein
LASARSSGRAERESEVVGELGVDEVGLEVDSPRGQGFSRGVDDAEVGLEEDWTPISSVDVDDREEDRVDIVRAIDFSIGESTSGRGDGLVASLPRELENWVGRATRLNPDDPLMSDECQCRELYRVEVVEASGGDGRRRRVAANLSSLCESVSGRLCNE